MATSINSTCVCRLFACLLRLYLLLAPNLLPFSILCTNQSMFWWMAACLWVAEHNRHEHVLLQKPHMQHITHMIYVLIKLPPNILLTLVPTNPTPPHPTSTSNIAAPHKCKNPPYPHYYIYPEIDSLQCGRNSRFIICRMSQATLPPLLSEMVFLAAAGWADFGREWLF